MIIVQDDVLPPRLLARVLEVVEDTNKFPWNYRETSSHSFKYDKSKYQNPASFTNSVYLTNYSGNMLLDKSEHFQLFDSVFLSIIDKMIPEIMIENLFRVRVAMTLKGDNKLPYAPHIDNINAHKTMLLYLNTCDGPTIIYDRKYESGGAKEDAEEVSFLDNIPILQTIDSVRNRVVIFDGETYHSATPPSDIDRRIVVNFNFKIKE